MRKSGFTLVELLVVISIISFLSATVLASLNTARLKAKDSAVKAGVRQFKLLMELEYDDTGSYSNLNKGWVGLGGTGNPLCGNRLYAGTRGAEATSVCQSIWNSTVGGSDNRIYTGVSGSFSNVRDYSIMAILSNGKFFCAGSSGRTSETVQGSPWTAPGCYNDP